MLTKPRNSAAAVSTLVAALAGLAALATGCGPSYPNCDKDDHCKRQNQVCVDKLCRDCRDDAQCNRVYPCRVCGSGYTCETKPGCCKSDLDCAGGRCWKTGGATGSCGGQCQTDDHCPAGQRCAGGACVPDVACTDDEGCGPGQRCERGKCVAAACEVEPVFFDFNEFTIRLDQEGTVRANADCLKQRMRNHRVEGHCDERGSDEYNLALGQRRAGAVVKQYKALGVSDGLLSTISYGEERPTCSQSSEDCWQKNRRAETVTQ
jgi:peptidoglycan-associated lipoprotein